MIEPISPFQVKELPEPIIIAINTLIKLFWTSKNYSGKVLIHSSEIAQLSDMNRQSIDRYEDKIIELYTGKGWTVEYKIQSSQFIADTCYFIFEAKE